MTVEVPCGQKALTYRHRPEPMTCAFDMSCFVIAESAVASELMILPSRPFPSLHTTKSLRDAEVYRLSLRKLPMVGVW